MRSQKRAFHVLSEREWLSRRTRFSHKLRRDAIVADGTEAYERTPVDLTSSGKPADEHRPPKAITAIPLQRADLGLSHTEVA